MIARPTKNFPDPDTIKNLARGLNVPATEVVMAAAHSLDIRVGPSDDTALTLQEAGTLPRERQQLLIDLARALIEGQEAMDRQEAAGSPEQDHLTQDMHDLAAHKGHRNIGLYDLPDE